MHQVRLAKLNCIEFATTLSIFSFMGKYSARQQCSRSVTCSLSMLSCQTLPVTHEPMGINMKFDEIIGFVFEAYPKWVKYGLRIPKSDDREGYSGQGFVFSNYAFSPLWCFPGRFCFVVLSTRPFYKNNYFIYFEQTTGHNFHHTGRRQRRKPAILYMEHR